MAYTEHDTQQILALLKTIENRKAHPNAAATYQDIPALQEIDRIVKAQLASEQPHDRDTLSDSIFAVRYLASAYESMWRIACVHPCHIWLFQLHLELYRGFQVIDEELADDYYAALRARNYYGRDDCPDLAAMAKELLPDRKRLEIEESVLVHNRPLQHDPVELTDAYLAVIDEVDRRMAAMGPVPHPLAWNQRFQELLREYGVDWEPMSSFNPGWQFH